MPNQSRDQLFLFTFSSASTKQHAAALRDYNDSRSSSGQFESLKSRFCGCGRCERTTVSQCSTDDSFSASAREVEYYCDIIRMIRATK